MTTEELLHTMNYNEVEEIKNELNEKLEACLISNDFGYRLGKIQLRERPIHFNKTYDVQFRLTLVSLVGLSTDAMRRLSNVLNEMRAVLNQVNEEYKGYKYIYA